MSDERVFLSVDDATALLADGDYIHTFRQAGPALIGASWPREELIDAMREHGVELSGATATSMHHGLCVVDDRGPLWIETKETTDE